MKSLKELFAGIVNKFVQKSNPQQDVFYINGAQVLPEPLSKEEETRVMQEIINGNEDIRETLITHNLRLVVYIAKKVESKGANVEDLISIGTIGLIKAVKTFKPEKILNLLHMLHVALKMKF